MTTTPPQTTPTQGPGAVKKTFRYVAAGLGAVVAPLAVLYGTGAPGGSTSGIGSRLGGINFEHFMARLPENATLGDAVNTASWAAAFGLTTLRVPPKHAITWPVVTPVAVGLARSLFVDPKKMPNDALFGDMIVYATAAAAAGGLGYLVKRLTT